MPAKRSCGKNLRLYLWKNALQRRRHKCAFLCEVCTPLYVSCGVCGMPRLACLMTRVAPGFSSR